MSASTQPRQDSGVKPPLQTEETQVSQHAKTSMGTRTRRCERAKVFVVADRLGRRSLQYNGSRKIIAQERVRYARTTREGLPEMGKVCEDGEKKPHPEGVSYRIRSTALARRIRPAGMNPRDSSNRIHPRRTRANGLVFGWGHWLDVGFYGGGLRWGVVDALGGFDEVGRLGVGNVDEDLWIAIG